MVHVRSTHVDDPQYQDAAQHWLVSVKDVSTLEETANMLAKRYSDHADALLKGKEMVEILAPLNVDTESLLAALLRDATVRTARDSAAKTVLAS